MAINLSGLSSATTSATALSNLILVTPNSNLGYQPQNSLNDDGTISTSKELPPALLFHYEGEQTVTLTSDITDHFVEDNTSRQDQISIKPIVITTHGFIGELNDVPPPGLALLKEAADRLTVINSYAPEISTTAQIAYSEALLLYQTANNAVDSAVAAWSSLSGGGEAQNKQQTMFNQFMGYWNNRILFTIQTPWNVFKNMAILNLRAIQGEDTVTITDFEVSFKRIQVASTLSLDANGLPINLDGRSATQNSDATDLGTSQPTESSTSLTDGIARVAA